MKNDGDDEDQHSCLEVLLTRVHDTAKALTREFSVLDAPCNDQAMLIRYLLEMIVVASHPSGAENIRNSEPK